tara:strand:- start:1056 stop:1484 length:429 start_codon:yes stop_codon:yes gene_type:complete
MVFDKKEYRQKNKQKTKEYMREYRKTEKFKRKERIRIWKLRGLISDDYDKLYDKLISTTHCELCNRELTIDKYNTSTTKMMDHDHSTGLFRNIICQRCNVKRDLPEFNKNEYMKIRNKYLYSWGGDKRYNNNLLLIDINLFT